MPPGHPAHVVEDFIVDDHLRERTHQAPAHINGLRATVRMPAYRAGGLAKLVGALSRQGWGINALGGSTVPREPEWYDAVITLEGVTKAQLLTVLAEGEGEQIMDVREV